MPYFIRWILLDRRVLNDRRLFRSLFHLRWCGFLYRRAAYFILMSFTNVDPPAHQIYSKLSPLAAFKC